jgi:uncharacterized membrane protein YsdA (DUF1294 family)
MTLNQTLLIIFIFINLVAFFIMASDKRKSMQRGENERIPEGFIFFMATAGGGVGVYAGMQLFRHKTRKWYFQIGIPLLILQNFATWHLLTEVLFT